MCGRRRRENPRITTSRLVEDRAIFGHDGVEEPGVGEDAEEVVELATGDEDELSTGGGEPPKGRHGFTIDCALGRQRAVVVGGEREESHGSDALRRGGDRMGSSRSPTRGEAASPMAKAPGAPGIPIHGSTSMRAFRKRGRGASPTGSLGRTPADQMMVAQAIAVPSESVTAWPFALLTSAPVRTVTPRFVRTRCA